MKNKIALVFALLTASALSAQDTSPNAVLLRLIEEAVPQTVGDRTVMERLLHPQVARPQLGESFDPKNVEKSVGDNLQPDKECPPFNKGTRESTFFRCDYRNKDGSFMRVNLGLGRVAYANPRRINLNMNNPLSMQRAMTTAAAAFAGFGIPSQEIFRPRAVKMVVGGQDGTRRETHFSAEPEWHVGITRMINGIPVANSRGMAVVDQQGAISRLMVRWPSFAIEPGYTPADTLSRQQVVASVFQRLAGQDPAQIARLKGVIKYAAANRVAGADRADETPSIAASSEPLFFVPALEVTLTPPSTGEDSGIIGEAGWQITVPLLSPRAVPAVQ